FLHGAPPTSACAAFIKESRMKFASARKLDRKSGVRRAERRALVQFLSLVSQARSLQAQQTPDKLLTFL
ncbi:MAG: hypothetical protein WCD57_09195, partial [Acidobacteriaceae bacterium]